MFQIYLDNWSQIADFDVERDCFACTVFKGKILVTGGINDYNEIKSVEAYDYYENKWTYLLEMIE